MRVLISYDDESQTVEIADHGWREPYPGELSGLASVIDNKPLPWWIDFGVVAAVILTVVGAALAIGNTGG